MRVHKIKRGLLIILGISLICTMSVTMYSVSKHTTLMQLITGTHGDNEANYRVAGFDISIDGKSDTMVDFKAYATTKLSDIEKKGDAFLPHSFVPYAYQTHTITVTNQSETVVNCSLSVTREENDSRVFYAILPDSENLLADLYTDTDISTPEKVKAYADSITYKTGELGIGETKSFTMVIWSEHDAVFPDSNGDGVADEPSQKLSELSDGIPADSFVLNYRFEQKD